MRNNLTQPLKPGEMAPAYAKFRHSLDVDGITEEEYFEKEAENRNNGGRKKRNLKIITLQDIRNYNDPEYLIEEILIEGTLNLLVSYTGLGKSLIALSIMRSIIDGFPLWGRYNVKKVGPVLLIDEETPTPFLKQRTANIDLSLPLFCLHFQGVRIDSLTGYQELIDAIKQVNPVLIVIDSLIRVHGLQEDSSSDMARVIDSLRKITNSGISIILIHHHRKGDGPLQQRARGSSDIIGGVDVEFSLSKKGDKLLFESVKSRVEPFGPIELEIYDNGGVPEIRYTGNPRENLIEAIKECTAEPTDFQTIQEYIESSGIDIGAKALRETIKKIADLNVTTGKHNKKMYQFGSLAGTL